MDVEHRGEPLTVESVETELPGRPVRVHQGVVSTEADARAWARQGAPSGSVVVAEHQIAARGRSARPWHVEPGRDVGLSIVLRPQLPAEREGWIWLLGSLALGDVLGSGHDLHWPDQARQGGALTGAVVVHADHDGSVVRSAVLSAMLVRPGPRRTVALGRFVESVERWLGTEVEAVLAGYRTRCATLGTEIRARLVPLTPDAATVVGRASDVRPDGSIVVETSDDRRVAIPPSALGSLGELDDG